MCRSKRLALLALLVGFAAALVLGSPSNSAAHDDACRECDDDRYDGCEYDRDRDCDGDRDDGCEYDRERKCDGSTTTTTTAPPGPTTTEPTTTTTSEQPVAAAAAPPSRPPTGSAPRRAAGPTQAAPTTAVPNLPPAVAAPTPLPALSTNSSLASRVETLAPVAARDSLPWRWIAATIVGIVVAGLIVRWDVTREPSLR